MKKNKMMRAASAMLVATLISTSAFSGTMAKYVSADSASDTARVAKFGVVASISGDLFGPTYDEVANTNKIITYNQTGGTVSASDSADTNLVAPGTHGSTMTFSVKGQPEVKTTITFNHALDGDGKEQKIYNAEPQLIAGDYGVMVEYTGELTKESIAGRYKSTDQKTFTAVAADEAVTASTKYYTLQDATGALANAYFPITWSYDTGTDALSGTATKTNSLATAKTAITAAFGTGGTSTIDPNTSNNKIASLTWDWFFEGGLDDTANTAPTDGSIYSAQDKADTILGNMIAATAASGKLGDADAYVVAKSSTTYKAIKTASVPVMSDSIASNKVTIAYLNDATEPACAYSAELSTLSTGVLAVLGVNFDASLTVVQVD